MWLDDCLWGVGDLILSESGYPGFSGFSGCGWMIVCGELGFFRMWLDDFWWGVGDLILSESGYPGFEDFQDVVG
jgi:hypothetical protein